MINDRNMADKRDSFPLQRRHLGLALIIFLSVWISAAAWAQGGAALLRRDSVLLIVVLGLVLFPRFVSEHARRCIPAIIYTIIAGAWLTSESREFLPRDACCLLGGTALMISLFVVISWYRRITIITGIHMWWIAIGSLAIAWALMSAFDEARKPSRIALDRSRFASTPVTEASQAVHIGIALSGGGFRAALYHAGVLHELERRGVQITHISSVSGGSIIGSFYALGGAPSAFLQAVCDHRFNLERDLWHIQNALRLPFPGHLPFFQVELFPWYDFSRTDVQMALLENAFLGATWVSELPKHSLGARAQPPLLMMCSTDLEHGILAGWCRDGMLLRGFSHPRPSDQPSDSPTASPPATFFPFSEHPIDPPNPEVALAVSVSGAFPGAFSPKRVVIDPDSPTRTSLLLGDGGIADNSGVRLLIHAHQLATDTTVRREDDWRLDLLLLSSGAAVLQDKGSLHGLKDVTRATHISRAFSASSPAIHDDDSIPPMCIMSPGELVKPIDQEILRGASAELADENPVSLANVHFSPEVESDMKEFMHSAGVAETFSSSYDRLPADFITCLKTFLQTPTLDDHVTDTDARAIYRLGEYMVSLKWQEMSAVLHRLSHRP